MGENSIVSEVYYKVTVTRGELSSSVYWWEKTYGQLMESVDFLYKYAKIDAVELEMISKEDYKNGE
tara:strand:- start:999 stop:1196 length:198 start_codon:yes stop_codon:yes gene_type:complete